MKQTETEFPGGGLVIWASKKRLIHLDAGVGDQSTTGQDGQAAGKGEKESRSNILHGDGREMKIFTGSSDSIGYRATIRKPGSGVMVCELYTDKSTMHRGWKTAPEGRRKIGSLIACRKRQQYAMLCEAVLESDGPNRVEARLAGKGRGPGLSQKQAWSKVLAQIGRSAGHPGRSLLA